METEIQEITEKMANIRKPYELSGKVLSRYDKKEIDALKAKQRYN